MLRNSIFLSALVAILACSSKVEPRVKIQRGEYNQIAIKVENATPEESERLLSEEQGFQEAHDRFVQMDLLSRFASGRLSEIFGESAVERDTLTLGVGLKEAAKNSTERLKKEEPSVYKTLEDFSRGVNRYLEAERSNPKSALTVYKRWTKNADYWPKEWTPFDSVASAEGISFYLSSSILEKILMNTLANLPSVGGPSDFARMFDTRAIENVYILNSGKIEDRPTNAARRDEEAAPRSPVASAVPLANTCIGGGFPLPECVRKSPYGSNNWVVSRKFAGGNEAYLANDPHLPLAFPTNFIELSMETPYRRVRGVGLPGVPGILIGHNDRIAWGFTNQPADVDDVYLEKMNSNQAVLFKGQWVKIENIKEDLLVRLSDGNTKVKPINIRWVPHHGPIVSDFFPEVREALKKVKDDESKGVELVVSYKWVGQRGTCEAAGILGVNKARNFDEFKNALQNFQAGAQNIVYADVDGNIGYYSHGLYPMRKYLNAQHPPHTVISGTGDFEWEPNFRTNVPELYNPESGRIVTANNDPYGASARKDYDKYEDYFGTGFADGIRAKRITELLDANKGNVSLSTIQRIQTDHKDLLALKMIETASRIKNSELSETAQDVLNELRGWDGVAERGRHEPVIMDSWLRSLVRVHFKSIYDYGGPDLTSHLFDSTLAAKTIYHQLNGWLDVNDPEKRKLVVSELNESLERTAKIVPTKPATWGEMNRLAFANQLEGILPNFLSAPLERDGSWETVDVQASVWGPNFRLIMVLKEGEPIKGVNVIAGGNYNPLESNDWMTELEMWRDGKYRDLVPFLN